jgi:hypothetical protein
MILQSRKKSAGAKKGMYLLRGPDILFSRSGKGPRPEPGDYMFKMTINLPFANYYLGEEVTHEVLNDIPAVHGFAPCPSKAVIVRPPAGSERPWHSLPVEVTFDSKEEARLWWSQLMGFPG